MSSPLRVTIWNEFIHERTVPSVQQLYPQGIHGIVAAALEAHCGSSVRTRTATLDEPEQGLPASVLNETDVLTWWGHAAHDRVSDDLVERIRERVLGGMGLVA